MDEREAIWRLQDHFRIHDDGRPTPKLDEAAKMAYVALNNQKCLRDMLVNYEKNPTAIGGVELINDIYKVYVYGYEDHMNMKRLFEDFKNHVDSMSDNEVRESISKTIENIKENRPKCCKDHDVYLGVCDLCEYGE